ncbi:hypothetical protein IMCC1989_182 [gamma proteobacterium IMCC1989]|nr:hypothetical protein IMCC1989_182 [gamma proteobacterium IMCC1989]
MTTTTTTTMTKKLHIAIATDNIEGSIKDYTARLGVEPCSFVLNEYALWRTDTVNFSIRQDSTCIPGQLRHLGWEDNTALSFSEEKDINGVVWERFSAQQQAEEINALWPIASYNVDY